jgi:hypothetical protein
MLPPKQARRRAPATGGAQHGTLIRPELLCLLFFSP